MSSEEGKEEEGGERGGEEDVHGRSWKRVRLSGEEETEEDLKGDTLQFLPWFLSPQTRLKWSQTIADAMRAPLDIGHIIRDLCLVKETIHSTRLAFAAHAADGTVHIWGTSYIKYTLAPTFAHAGIDGLFPNPVLAPKYVKVTNVLRVCVAPTFFLLVRNDKSVYIWGNLENSNLNTIILDLLADTKSIVMKHDATVALLHDGSLIYIEGGTDRRLHESRKVHAWHFTLLQDLKVESVHATLNHFIVKCANGSVGVLQPEECTHKPQVQLQGADTIYTNDESVMAFKNSAFKGCWHDVSSNHDPVNQPTVKHLLNKVTSVATTTRDFAATLENKMVVIWGECLIQGFARFDPYMFNPDLAVNLPDSSLGKHLRVTGVEMLVANGRHVAMLLDTGEIHIKGRTDGHQEGLNCDVKHLGEVKSIHETSHSFTVLSKSGRVEHVHGHLYTNSCPPALDKLRNVKEVYSNDCCLVGVTNEGDVFSWVLPQTGGKMPGK